MPRAKTESCPCCSGLGIHRQNPFPPFIPRVVGPFPFRSPDNQLLSDRVVVNRFDHLPQRGRLIHVSIISRSGLSESDTPAALFSILFPLWKKKSRKVFKDTGRTPSLPAAPGTECAFGTLAYPATPADGEKTREREMTFRRRANNPLQICLGQSLGGLLENAHFEKQREPARGFRCLIGIENGGATVSRSRKGRQDAVTG